MATLDEALGQMLAAGMPDLPAAPQVNTSRIIRYGPKKRAWYRLYESVARNGRAYVHGAYGFWGAIDATKIETDWSGIDEAERARMQREAAAAEAREREKREERARFAANRARQQWDGANRLGGSEYLKRKRVVPEPGLRFYADGTVLVPMMRYDGKPRLMGVQKISADGTKRFNAGMAKEGCSCRLGRPPKDGEPVCMVEGLATGLSVRMATASQVPVFVAFDAGSLLPVARILRALLPSSPVLILADDDYATAGNPGITKAEAAAAAIGNARVAAPVFAQRAAGTKWTDWNDLHVAEGLEVVAEQVTRALDMARSGSGAPAQPGAAASAAARTERPLRRDVIRDLLAHYVLLRGTDTVWDGENREILSVGNLRLAVGKREVDYWVAHPERRTVLSRNVAFDPTESVGVDHVNLFDPAEMAPPQAAKPGKCALMLELIQYLCDEGGQEQAPITDWLLDWLAYPLQVPGAKMHTAVVMAGAEGTGKNLLFGSVKEMYGRYGGIITQTELESPYTAWRSRKLFIVANEVVTRQEMRHQVGKLKNLVTEGDLPIDEKYMPLRYEANHVNLVFLSNERQPIFISKGDRRYLVIRTPGPRDDAFYAAVAEELRGGGTWALREFLLERDLSTFGPWKKPPATGAKEELIEQGMSSVEIFVRDWRSGDARVPFCSALTEHLYTAYRRHCDRIGERQPLKINRWRPELLDVGRVLPKGPDGLPWPEGEAFDPEAFRVADGGRPRVQSGQTLAQRSVVVVGRNGGGADEMAARLRADVLRFRDALGGSDEASE